MLLASALAAQGPPDRFAGREEVTAVDLVVEVMRTVGPSAGAPLPGGLGPDDFTVLFDGQPLPVVAVEPPRAGDNPSEPWTLVLYFDLGLSTSADVRWAAEALAQRAAALTALGSVEVVVTDPGPRRVLAASRDPQRVQEAVAGVAQRFRGRDELVALRREFLGALDDPEIDAGPVRVAQVAAAAEADIVRRHLDDLVTWLAADTGVSSRRALLLVSRGFDLDPRAFYLSHLPAAAKAEAETGAALVDLAPAPAADDAARTLAAYGWIAICLAPEPVEEKWHGRRRLQARIDRNFNLEKAAAYDQLGLALRAQGKLADAREAFEDAIHHYNDYPATRPKQAEAVVHLGETLALEGRHDEAEEAFRSALELDPTLAGRFPALGATLADPGAALAALATATAGRLVREDEALAAALTSLDRRVRLTYQVPGLPDGGLHAVEAHIKKVGWRAEAPPWARSSTPETVAEARLRRLLAGDLAGDLAGGDLRLGARFVLAPAVSVSGDRQGTVHLRLELPPGGAPADPARPILLRVSVATGGPDATPETHHQRLPPQALTGGEGWTFSTDVTLAPGRTAIAVVVEDLLSRKWGEVLIDLGPLAASGPDLP